jgi:hypothetical protein
VRASSSGTAWAYSSALLSGPGPTLAPPVGNLVQDGRSELDDRQNHHASWAWAMAIAMLQAVLVLPSPEFVEVTPAVERA